MMSDRDIDSLEEDLDSLELEEDADDWRQYLRFAPMILAAGAFVLFSFIVLIAYWGDDDDDDERPQQIAAPVLAPQTAIKIEPEQPGGMEIPDQDKLVYNQLNQGADDGQVEQILPGAETPKEPPKEPSQADAAKPPAEAGVIPPPGAEAVPEPGVALLSEPQTPAPKAPATDAAKPDATATPDMKTVPGEPTKAGDMAAATIPPPPSLVIPDQPQTPAPEGTAPTAQTPILNGPKTPAAAKPTVPGEKAKKPKAVATTQMRTLAGVYRVQVASLKSPALAEREWSAQVKKNPDLLSKLSLTVQRAVMKNGGTYYRVQAGPIQDRDSADKLCRNLRSRGQDCIVVRP